MSGTPVAWAVGAASPGLLLRRLRGSVMIFGIGRTSRSKATLAAAWNAWKGKTTDELGNEEFV